jgi:viroplasmin and RNaseH domain-containing protein
MKDNKPYRHFDTLEEAFDFCREKNHPVTVEVDYRLFRLFPSGKADRL